MNVGEESLLEKLCECWGAKLEKLCECWGAELEKLCECWVGGFVGKVLYAVRPS